MRTKDKYVSRNEFDKLHEDFINFRLNLKTLLRTMKEEIRSKANKKPLRAKSPKKVVSK